MFDSYKEYLLVDSSQYFRMMIQFDLLPYQKGVLSCFLDKAFHNQSCRQRNDYTIKRHINNRVQTIIRKKKLQKAPEIRKALVESPIYELDDISCSDRYLYKLSFQHFISIKNIHFFIFTLINFSSKYKCISPMYTNLKE